MTVRGASHFRVPWAAWHRDDSLKLQIPPTWSCAHYTMQDAPALTDDQIRHALNHTVGSAPLEQICAGKKHIAIAVDDLSRPTPTGLVLRHFLKMIEEAKPAPERVTIIISLGAHTPLGREQLVLKLGREVVDRYRIVNHDCRAGVSPSGAFAGKLEVRLNREFLEAEARFLIGSVVPHHFAGFSGAAKMVLPGLADLDAISWTHKAVLMGLRGRAGTLENNRFRQDFERVARSVGVDAVINVVVNGDRGIAGLFAGDLVEAHRLAAERAREVYATEIPASPLDAAVFNCYPKDTELIQAENAFMYMHSAGTNLLKENGSVVVLSACSEGLGRHGLFEPDGGVLYRKPAKKRFLADRHLIFYSPNLDAESFYKLYWDGYDFCTSWSCVVEKLNARHGPNLSLGVFPHASIQIATNGH